MERCSQTRRRTSVSVDDSKGDFLDDRRKDWKPFVLIVQWRKTRTLWLWQFPILIFCSARSLRLLASAR